MIGGGIFWPVLRMMRRWTKDRTSQAMDLAEVYVDSERKEVVSLTLLSLQAQMIAGFTRGTRRGPLPLLPSGPGGVHGLPLRAARLSSPPAS
jgi:hypothetical protein